MSWLQAGAGKLQRANCMYIRVNLGNSHILSHPY